MDEKEIAKDAKHLRDIDDDSKRRREAQRIRNKLKGSFPREVFEEENLRIRPQITSFEGIASPDFYPAREIPRIHQAAKLLDGFCFALIKPKKWSTSEGFIPKDEFLSSRVDEILKLVE